jgi:hypothetical protein
VHHYALESRAGTGSAPSCCSMTAAHPNVPYIQSWEGTLGIDSLDFVRIKRRDFTSKIPTSINVVLHSTEAAYEKAP